MLLPMKDLFLSILGQVPPMTLNAFLVSSGTLLESISLSRMYAMLGGRFVMNMLSVVILNCLSSITHPLTIVFMRAHVPLLINPSPGSQSVIPATREYVAESSLHSFLLVVHLYQSQVLYPPECSFTTSLLNYLLHPPLLGNNFYYLSTHMLRKQHIGY